MTNQNAISRREFQTMSAVGAGALLMGAAASGDARARQTETFTYLLVHGAWHGGWCYSRVADRLRSLGHRVYTPTLTGLGERSHLSVSPAVNCSTHVEDILNVIRYERLTDVVLCGHSYGGMVVSAVADRVPERIRALVYLDSLIPESGKSFLDQVGTPEYVAQLVSTIGAHGGQMLPAFTAAAFNVNTADRGMVDELCTPQSFATFVERMALSGAFLTVPRKMHILATGWEQSPFATFHAKAKASDGWLTEQFDCGHDVMIDRPEDLVRSLLRVAR